MSDAMTTKAALERHERRWKRPWHRFSMTRRGRMSWADWFKAGAA